MLKEEKESNDEEAGNNRQMQVNPNSIDRDIKRRNELEVANKKEVNIKEVIDEEAMKESNREIERLEKAIEEVKENRRSKKALESKEVTSERCNLKKAEKKERPKENLIEASKYNKTEVIANTNNRNKSCSPIKNPNNSFDLNQLKDSYKCLSPNVYQFVEQEHSKWAQKHSKDKNNSQ